MGLVKSLDISISRPMLSPTDFNSITTTILNEKVKEYCKTITTSEFSLSLLVFNYDLIHNLALTANNIPINALPPLRKLRCIQLMEFLSKNSANNTKGVISKNLKIM